MLSTFKNFTEPFKKASTSVLMLLIVFDWWALLFNHTPLHFINISAKSSEVAVAGAFYLAVYSPATLIVVLLAALALMDHVWKRTRNDQALSKIMSAYLVTYISRWGLVAFNFFLLSGSLRYINGWTTAGTLFILSISTLLNTAFFISELLSDTSEERA